MANIINDALANFLDDLSLLLTQHLLIKLVLSKYRGQEENLQKVSVRPIILKDEHLINFVYSYKTRDITKNLPIDEAFKTITMLLDNGFKSIHLFSNEAEIQCEISKKGKVTVRKKQLLAANPDSKIDNQHNRQKKRFVDINKPFLTELKVTDNQHQLIPAMSNKWKQINKFIEIFSQAITDSDLINQNKGLDVVDFGSGKGYLTFALHDYLQSNLENGANVIGVELRKELADLCNHIARQLDHKGLTFVCGDVKTHAPKNTDVMIALHACDVATDYAIHYGIRANASIIMCSPCCHKQIRPQIKSPELLKPLLKYGVHLGQEAEMVTDSLRALLLEAYGYSTKVFEFISLEHTNKNKMILAVKKKKKGINNKLIAEIAAIKSFYGITEHCLETLLLAEN